MYCAVCLAVYVKRKHKYIILFNLKPAMKKKIDYNIANNTSSQPRLYQTMTSVPHTLVNRWTVYLGIEYISKERK